MSRVLTKRENEIFVGKRKKGRGIRRGEVYEPKQL
jgi:hypothetical protein